MLIEASAMKIRQSFGIAHPSIKTTFLKIS